MAHNFDIQLMRLRLCLGATAGGAVVRKHGLQGGVFRHRAGHNRMGPGAVLHTGGGVTLTASNKPSV